MKEKRIRKMYNTTSRKNNSFLMGAAAFLTVFICIAAILLAMTGQFHLPGSAASPGRDIPELELLDKNDPLAREILDHSEDYTPELIKLFAKNPDARDFVMGYPEHKNDTASGSLTSEECAAGSMPLLLQWDSRWGYIRYGTGPIGITGCGPTCLSMVLTGLTGDSQYTPAYLASFSQENGYYTPGSGTQWSLMNEGVSKLGLNVSEVPLWEDSMAQELNSGHPIIANMGAGDFTENGHYIVLTGYSDGAFTVNDPNSPTRSARTWTYTELESQICALWSYSA